MTFSRTALRSCTVLAALLAASALQAQDAPVSLKLRWLPGKTYTQETTTETNTALTAVGKAADVKMKVVQTTVIQVEGEEKGPKEARVTFKGMTGEVMLDGKLQTFDSKDLREAHPMIKASVGQSVGKSFVMLYDKDDTFVEVKDTGAMTSSNLGNPVLVELAEAKEVAELYRQSLEMGLPKIKVKPGDRWTSQQTIQFPSAGTVNVELRVKFDAIVNYETGPHAKISFEGDMKSEEAAGSVRQVVIGKGSKTFGQILFDIDRGTVSFGAFRADITLDVQGQKLPIRQQVATKLLGIE
ncbi:hypothetical protein WJU23_06950 [Prosthecobacter sp. SYSU 5D2]|uniref:hypothetical protein n=1 Tax=Prosthecobacter sp. SYSU 5D2 TaxID=3134134 RepID=UPI0031FE674E